MKLSKKRKNTQVLFVHIIGLSYLLLVTITYFTSTTEAYFVDRVETRGTFQLHSDFSEENLIEVTTEASETNPEAILNENDVNIIDEIKDEN